MKYDFTMTAREESAEIELLREIAAHIYNNGETTVKGLPGAGSGRRYYRLTNPSDERVLIATAGDSPRENATFVTLAKVLRDGGVNVPSIMGCFGPDGEEERVPYRNIKLYLQEDLGDLNLLEYFKGCDERERERMMKKVCEQLVKAQQIPVGEWEKYVMNSPFDSSSVLSDLHYFKYCFLKVCGIEFDEQELEREFETLARLAVGKGAEGLMLRDFQSRNIMVRLNQDGEPEPWFIDFQGARRGPVLYDIVSFLWQTRLGLSSSVRQRETERYLEEYSRRSEADRKDMLGCLAAMIGIRTLQVLGAYGLRGLIERKPQFLTSIGAGVENLVKLLEDPCNIGSIAGWNERGDSGKILFPELWRVAGLLSERFGKSGEFTKENYRSYDGLTVRVSSFSYKKGYPEDFGGNGGGFVFDCRALPNPGRYNEFKLHTGMDSDVAAFLSDKEEVAEFQNHVRALVGQAVSNYLERGFTSLSVSFGCTGGRHRSVYNCERMAEWIKDKYPKVRVLVNHREQNIEREEL